MVSARNLRHGEDLWSSTDEGHRAEQGNEVERKRWEGCSMRCVHAGRGGLVPARVVGGATE